MSAPTLHPARAAAIERELAAIGTPDSRLERRQRRARRTAIACGAVALAGAVTAAAVLVSSLPGETTVTPLGHVVTGTYTGTASVELGLPPADAAVVILEVTCTDGGMISVPLAREGISGADEVSWDCSSSIRRDSVRIPDGRLPAPGNTSITITADPGTEWSVTAEYASSSTTAWGVNASGQTYGVPNSNGLPDLQAAQATNGKVGYIFTEELMAMGEDRFINVYDSDGTTVIGQFPIGDVFPIEDLDE
jgi:hypothetical protein